MKNRNIAFILTLILAVSISAQIRRNTIGPTSLDLSYGALSILSGDLDVPMIQKNNTLLSIGFHQAFSNKLALKAAFEYGFYNAAQSNNSLLFYTNMYALNVRGEYNLLNFDKDYNNSLYVFAGLGVALILGENLNGTAAVAFNNTNPLSPTPFVNGGLGYIMKVSNRISLGIEGDLHYFISDLIDGYPKPNSYPHDMTSTATIRLKYKIFGKNFKSFKSNCNCE